jgi:zinc transport system substrate-binding protein
MFKNVAIMFGLLILVILAIFVFPFYNPNEKVDNRKLTVATTIYPIYDMVKNIGGDKINLHQIIPFGQEPHSFEPTPKDIIQISNSQIFIYTGLGVDLWATNLGDIAKKGDKFINLSSVSNIDGNNPHFWLSVENMRKMADEITQRLIKFDEKNRVFYKNSLIAYTEKLDKMDEKFKEGLKNCKLDTIVVNHNAFSYLAKSYNFKSFSIMGISPDNKPSAKTIADIIDLVREQKMTTIFFEELASDSVISSISQETGAKVDSLSPLGNVPPEKVETGYINLMYQNLEKIEKALICQ